jgi:DNA-binding SARP family transcriptional activator
VVMVVPGPAEAVGLVLSVDADGSVTVNDHRLRVRQLDEGAMASVDELLETAASPAVPPGDDQLKPPAPVIAGEHPVPPSGSALHELLREVDVLVRVLGPVEAVRLTPDGETRLRVGKQKSLEAITYLALRETPVDREELQAALWPAGTNSAKTFQNVVWAARKALGADRDGAELLPDPVDGRYGSNPRLVTDYGLFHELVTRAAETDDPTEAARLLADALRVVRGEPFVGVGRNYVWVAPHAGMVVAQVVDAAEELAEMRLAAGDCRGAEEAARAGLRVFPCEERLYRVLMRCAHASGSRAGVQRAFDELVARAADPDGGVEPEDTVHEDTIALLEELTRARPGSS